LYGWPIQYCTPPRHLSIFLFLKTNILILADPLEYSDDEEDTSKAAALTREDAELLLDNPAKGETEGMDTTNSNEIEITATDGSTTPLVDPAATLDSNNQLIQKWPSEMPPPPPPPQPPSTSVASQANPIKKKTILPSST